LRLFIKDFGALLNQTDDEARILDAGARLLENLVRHDDWLPAAFAEPDPERYRQYLLHCDSLERFCVVAFVWGPGQQTPIHNHTIWGLVGVLRGSEIGEQFEWRDGRLATGRIDHLHRGQVEAVSPTIGDIHKVSNADPANVSISIHVYGANIGAVERSTFDLTGHAKPFISGYANTTLPNIWDRSHSAQSAPTASKPH
jgi:predicted metal-dependent enzyme (double-stranded beta helix superfamily)